MDNGQLLAGELHDTSLSQRDKGVESAYRKEVASLDNRDESLDQPRVEDQDSLHQSIQGGTDPIRGDGCGSSRIVNGQPRQGW